MFPMASLSRAVAAAAAASSSAVNRPAGFVGAASARRCVPPSLFGGDVSQQRWKSSGSNSPPKGGGGGGSKNNSSRAPSAAASSFRPRRAPGQDYFRSKAPKAPGGGSGRGRKGPKGPREPNDVSTPFPRIDLSKIRITDPDDADDMEDDDDLSTLGPLMGGAVRMLRAQSSLRGAGATRRPPAASAWEDDVEAQLRMMDHFTSSPGSTEDLVGARRAVALEALPGEDPAAIMADIDRFVEEERLQYMDLPPTDPISLEDLRREENKGTNQIPKNQLAHGDWCVSASV